MSEKARTMSFCHQQNSDITN